MDFPPFARELCCNRLVGRDFAAVHGDFMATAMSFFPLLENFAAISLDFAAISGDFTATVWKLCCNKSSCPG